jgi:hypothetical protein
VLKITFPVKVFDVAFKFAYPVNDGVDVKNVDSVVARSVPFKDIEGTYKRLYK